MNALIAEELTAGAKERSGSEAPLRVIDLGCGVGGSMIYLADRLPGDFRGVTISGVQADMGNAFVAERGLGNIVIDEGDYTDRAYWSRVSGGSGFDAAFAVESMIHIPSLLSRLPLIADQLAPGGRLIVVDDMISRAGARRYPAKREQRWLAEFERGWYAHGLVSVDQFTAAARDAGLALREVRDLTPYLELDRPRDLLARAFMAGFRWLPLRPAWFNNLLGGNALQLALKSGVLGYYYLVFTA